MDIRNFFGGGGKASAKPKGPSSAKTTKNTSEKSKKPDLSKPKTKTPTKEKSKVEKKSSKSSEIVVIDSETEEPPIKVKQQKVESVNDNEKVVEKKTKSKEVKVKKTETSPSEKENKKAQDKEVKEKEQKKGGNKSVKSEEKGEKAKSKRGESTERKSDTSKGEKSAEKKAGKRKSAIRVESSDEDEAFAVKRKVASSSKGKSKKGARIFDSDSDEEVIPPTQEETKSARRKKHKVFVSDSDDEDKQMSIGEAFKKATKGTPKNKTPKSEEKPKMKSCSLTDFFGASPSVTRVERKVLPVKRKAESSPQKQPSSFDNDDMEIHDDDDFEQTLLQLDTTQIEQQSKRAKLDEVSTSSEGPSLASKLSSRVKKEDATVKETPDKKKSRTMSDIEIVEETPKRTKTPEKKSPVKSSPRKKTPAKTSPAKTKSPVRQINTPTAVKKSPEDKVSNQPSGSEGVTPKGGRGGPGYRSYLQRAPPSAIGSKEIPEGGANCLEGLTFVITGVLESMERDDAKALVERYGGKVTTSISKRTSYVVFGRDAGISKTAKAEEFGTKQLDEDGLLKLIRTLPGKKSKYEISAELEAKKAKQATPKAANRPSLSTTPVASPSRPSPKPSPSVRPSPRTTKASSSQSVPSSPRMPPEGAEPTLMWVDKYKPTSLKQVIGQQGPKSNANKLLNWLKNWHKWQAEGRKPAFNRFSDDGAGYRCALLSGPPGVGKTTTATLVCQEMKFSYVELNASDTRSKKSLDTVVSELLGNHTLVDFFGEKGHNQANDGKQHCLIMDEVDGMAGNEDRGGMQELISLIKKSRIPIICMCNDRNHQKVRSLANYCFDLRFQRPRVEQIKAAMMSLAYKEGVKIPPPALNEVITAANQDVRQIIHNLSMWSVADKTLTHEQLKRDSAKATKDMKIGPFDVCRKVFVGGDETANMTINDKSDLFFHDYSFGPLFVHENYIHAMPFAARGDKKKHLECISKAMDAISDGDLVDRKIRGNQNWSLLPTQAMFASVIPGEVMRGGFNHMVTFPQWLGKNSTTNKTDRILQELHTHMSLKLSGDRRALNMDYVPHFRRSLSQPLVKKQNEGVADVVSLLHEYDLLREDYDNILEISQWSHLKEPLAGVDSKTKAAFTRTYNKEAHLTPYAAVQGAKKRRGGGGGGETDLMGEEDAAVLANDDAESDEDVSKDAMIKPAKKAKGRGAASASTAGKGKGRGKAQTTRGRGRGRGKAK